MDALKHLRTGKRAARMLRIAVGARYVLCGLTVPLLALTLWVGMSRGIYSAIAAALLGFSTLGMILRHPLPEGRANVPLLTLGAKGIQIEPAARPGLDRPLLFLWSEIEKIAIHHPMRGRPYLKIVPSLAAAVTQGLRPANWLPSALTRWTRPIIRIRTELFDCPEAKLIDTIGAVAADQGIPVIVQQGLDGGLRLHVDANTSSAGL